MAIALSVQRIPRQMDSVCMDSKGVKWFLLLLGLAFMAGSIVEVIKLTNSLPGQNLYDLNGFDLVIR